MWVSCARDANRMRTGDKSSRNLAFSVFALRFPATHQGASRAEPSFIYRQRIARLGHLRAQSRRERAQLRALIEVFFNLVKGGQLNDRHG